MAAKIGDVRAYARTLLHFVYLDIQEGKFVSAKRTMRRLWAHAHGCGDGGLAESVRAAWVHMGRVRRVATMPPPAAVGTPDTEDPFYRQRLLGSSSARSPSGPPQ